MNSQTVLPSLTSLSFSSCIIAFGAVILISIVIVVLILIMAFLLFIAQAILEVLLLWLINGPHARDHEVGESIHLTQNFPHPSIQDAFSQTSGQDMTLLEIFVMEVLERFQEDREEELDQRQRVMEMLPPPTKYKIHSIESSCNVCVICLEDFVDDDPCRTFDVCKHTFHLECIDSWLNDHVTCPICHEYVINV